MTEIFASIVIGAEPDLIHECVRSLLRSAGTHQVRVRVVINHLNAFPAESVRVLESLERVTVIANPQPIGFAANHNQALRDARAKYILVANDDLVFHDNAVELAIDEMELDENANVAALSPRLLNEDGTLQRSTYGFPTVFRALLDLSGIRDVIPHNRLTEFIAQSLGWSAGKSRFWQHDVACDVDTFRGAAMFIRSAAWKQVGEFSEIARVGGEIADWHRRCQDLGWRVRFFPAATVTHFGSRTVSRDRLLKSEYLKGYLLYFARHKSPLSLMAFRALGSAVCAGRLAIAMMRADEVETTLWRTNAALLRDTAWLSGNVLERQSGG